MNIVQLFLEPEKIIDIGDNMANRPIYVPQKNSLGVDREAIEFKWFPGMAATQKQKCIASLHEQGTKAGISPILEISSKSEKDLGIKLSAFNLCFTTKKYEQTLTVETAFQGSKAFERGGPYKDLYFKSSREAKKDSRLKESGNLVGFKFFGQDFPLSPRTFFYDWIYVNALYKNQELTSELVKYNGFTDIEFNPQKSINCQAYSAALYVTLVQNRLLSEALKSPERFLKVLQLEYRSKDKNRTVQGVLM